MARTNEEIDNLNKLRLVAGETQLPYETEETDKAEQERLAAELKQKEIDDKKTADDVEAERLRIAAEKKAEEEKTKVAEPELDDEKIIAYLKNKKGKEISSLDDLINPKVPLTEEQKKEEAEKREADKIAYGLKKGLFTKKQLEEFITDSKNPTETVFSVYAANQKELDPTLSDDDIKEEFENEFGLKSDKDSRTYKKGQTLLANIADNIIHKRHSKILNLENDFSAHENSFTKEKEQEANVKTKMPIYKSAIEKIGNDLRKVSIPISGTENFEMELEDIDVKDIVENMMDDKYATKNIDKSEQELKQIADTTKFLKNLPKILKKYGEKVLLEKQAGTRGILPGGKTAGRSGTVEHTEDQKKAIAMIEQMQIAN